MKKTIVYFLIFTCFLSIVYAADLSDFPDMFIEDGKLNALIVVGNDAPSSDVIAQTNLALFFTSYLGKPVTGYSKLASEVDNLEQNLILIGSPCNNDISLEILDAETCNEGLEQGEAIIKLVEGDENSYLMVMSGSDKGVREAANVLANYEDYNLNGDEFVLDVEDDVQQEDEKQRLIEEINSRISENDDEAEDAEDEMEPVEEKEEANIEQEQPEEVEEESEGPQPILKDEDNLIKKIIAWFLALFRR